jgi:predicted RNA-binding protein with RPS1 domain
MASIALPMKGTTFNLLVNPPPSPTCSSRITPVSCTRLNLNLSIRTLSRLLHSTHTVTHISKGVGTLFFPNYASGSCTVLATLESDVTVEGEEATHSETTSCDPKPLQGNESAPSSVGANDQQMPKRIQRAVGRVAVVPTSQLVPGAIFSGKITAVQKFGAFVEIGAFTVGLVHISQISSTYIKDIHDAVSVGQEVKVKVLKVDEKAGRISLSMRETGSGQIQQSEDSVSASSPGDGDGLSRRKVAGPSARATGGTDRKVCKLCAICLSKILQWLCKDNVIM